MAVKKNYKVRATFIGSNSMGYEKGNSYLLYIYFTTKGVKIRLLDSEREGKGLKWYVTFRSFLAEWDNISNV